MSFGYQFITDPKYSSIRDRGPEGPTTPIDSNNGRPFRYSIFQRFYRKIMANHQHILFEQSDIPLLVYIMNTFVLNNSQDSATIDMMAKNLRDHITEQTLKDEFTEGRVLNLARTLK